MQFGLISELQGRRQGNSLLSKIQMLQLWAPFSESLHDADAILSPQLHPADAMRSQGGKVLPEPWGSSMRHLARLQCKRGVTVINSVLHVSLVLRSSVGWSSLSPAPCQWHIGDMGVIPPDLKLYESVCPRAHRHACSCL